MKGVIWLGLENLPDVVTLQQLAEFLQVSEQTVRRFVKAGKIKAFKLGKDWRFYKTDIEKWIEESEVK